MENDINKTLLKIRIRDWFVRHAEGPHMKAWLSFFSFAEATFFPIPPDILLIAILIARKERWIYYATLTTITSVLGGVAGYFIGSFLFDVIGKQIIEAYHFGDEMQKVGVLFADNAFLAIFVSAFSPIPYKVFTLSAGFFHISLMIFIIASIIGRALRFFIVAFCAQKFGDRLGNLIFTYFNTISIIVAIIIIAFVLFVR
ncbi:MAG: DedA family protein [Parcubacteria group bacterium]|nr:DedA family protein [Parcubacteria group bacterium]